METLEAENRTLLTNLYVWTLVTCLCSSSSAATAAVRLAGVGSTQCSGRIEIQLDGSWGTVCDRGWDLDDARVVCRELGCGLPMTATLSAAFGQGVGEVWLDSVSCSGNESSLTQCSHGGVGSTDCQHSRDAGVVCSGVHIRLAGGTRCSGRVEVQHGGVWGTVCNTSWGLPEAQVVCRQLNCGAALQATGSASFGQGTGRIWLNAVACSGDERSLAECRHAGFGQHNCNHSEDAGVICSVSLPKPRISITPVGEVTWGQEVSINCSITTQGPGGIFILKKTFGSFKRTQTSTSNSVTFRVPDVDFNSAGPYQCQYQRRSLTHEFNSPPSDSVTVTVIASPLQPATPVAFGCLLVLLVVLLLVCVFYRRPQIHKTTTNMITTRVRDIHLDHEVQYVNIDLVKDTRRRQKQEDDYEEPLKEGEHDYEEAGTSVNYMEAKSVCVSGEEGDSDDANEYENITVLLY